METKRLLLVEDDPDNLELFTVMLGEKYEVLSYSSPADALMAFQVFKPDLLVLDVGMRPVSGLECLDAIRAIPGYGSIPAIALTGFARAVERNAFLTACFQAVVTKPVFDQTDLEVVIDRLLKSTVPFAGPSSD